MGDYKNLFSFNGGTITGSTIFTNNVTVNTLSATTITTNSIVTNTLSATTGIVTPPLYTPFSMSASSDDLTASNACSNQSGLDTIVGS